MNRRPNKMMALMIAVALLLTGASIAIGAGTQGEQTRKGVDELIGLWAAERNFGPEVKGPVRLLRRDGDLTAIVVGYELPASTSGGEVRFEAPGDRGYFRGRLSDDERLIEGHWVQPWNYSSFSRFASPVTLRRDDDGAWTGVISPKPDRLWFYLVIDKAKDGRTRAFLRNPEANIGRFYRIADVKRADNVVQFLDAEGRPDAHLAVPSVNSIRGPSNLASALRASLW